MGVTIMGFFFFSAEQMKVSLQPFKLKRPKEAPKSKSQTRNCHLPSDPTRVPRSGGQGPEVNRVVGGWRDGYCQEVGREGSEVAWAAGHEWLLHPILPLCDSPLPQFPAKRKHTP